MLARLNLWLDNRTGYRKMTEVLLIEHIPGGARWRYVWGSCLAFVFSLQLITGLLLMTSYSPGDSTAWSSVFFIQYQVDFGWLIRGVHHFGAQAMVVLLAVHMLQVVIAGAHLPPREVNWWLGLLLLFCVLGLSLTGYLLPWDQKGYWATQVATNIAGNMPGLGPTMQKIAVGGPAYGNQTLTRFYTLHVGVLPPLVVVLIIAHLVVFRRHGVTYATKSKSEGWFWPDQAFRDMLVSMAIFAVIVALVLYGHGHRIESDTAPEADADGATPASSAAGLYDRWAHAGREGLGANLDAPADPARPYPARPEWYFLFLFQLLKYFEGDREIIGTAVIPTAAMLALFLLPLLGYGRMRPFGHVVGVCVIGGLFAGVGVLTYLALAADRPPASGDSAQLSSADKEQFEKARLFQEQLEEADRLADRSIQLAAQGIPAAGAIALLRHDPGTQGKKLFGQNCAVCHSYGSDFPDSKARASDLENFGSAAWIKGLLSDPASPHFFGHTKLRTMSNWVQRTRDSAKKKGREAEAKLNAELDQIADWLGGHPLGKTPDESDQSAFARSYRAFEERCGRCHMYRETGGGDAQAPDFTGYGSADWLRVMLMVPADPSRYGAHNRMPAFRDLEGPTAEATRLEFRRLKQSLAPENKEDDAEGKKKRQEIDEALRLVQLSNIDRELIIRWLLKDDRVVFGGEPISAAPR